MTTGILRQRLAPDERQATILAAAVELAARTGYRNMTRDAVAEAAGVSPGLITFYFLHMSFLREAVVEEAVRRGIVPIVAEGIVAGAPAALAAPQALKAQAAVSLLGAV